MVFGVTHYTVSLLWHQRPQDNFAKQSSDMVVQHLKSTDLRLLKMPEVAEQYCDVLQQHIKKGYVERIHDVDLSQAVWFFATFHYCYA